MNDELYQLGLADLLNRDLSCYEFFCGLPQRYRREIEAKDVRSFEEMQDCVEKLRRNEWA